MWNATLDTLPNEGTHCDTISEGGMEQDLVYSKGLWFYPDFSMYVYYTPKFWRIK